MTNSNSAPVFVLAISLGPVQDFIASARRCRDLWFGSWLLSELSKAAAANLPQTSQPVFPPPGTDLNPHSPDLVANKIVAVVYGDTTQIAGDARVAAQKRLIELTKTTFDRLQRNGANFRRDIAQLQLDDLIEWNWAAARIEGEPDAECPDAEKQTNFSYARAQAESWLAARKNCRDFARVEWGSDAYKSSLDGAREAVIEADEYQNLTPAELYERYGVRRGERLCGVALLKRQGERQHQESRISSTSHVAAQGLLARWDAIFDDKTKAKEFVQGFTTELLNLDLPPSALDSALYYNAIFEYHDGHLLFPGRLAEFFVAPEKPKHNRDAAQAEYRDKVKKAKARTEAAQKLLDDLLFQLNERQGKVAPHPYYAVLLADGDKMGSSISEAKTIGANQEISKRLSRFAELVGETVKEAKGTLIYAGGDDVLALLPLHTALECTRKLADQFKATLDGAPTLSAGLAIVHHLEPLSEALTLARKAEKAAKAIPGKNALAVTLSKRSGSEETIAGKWDELDVRLQTFIGWARAGALSAGLAYEWRDLAMRVRAHNELEYAVISQIWRAEAVRLLERKREKGGKKEVSDTLKARLTAILDEAIAREAQKPPDKRGDWLTPLAQEIIIAREFAAALGIAEPQAPTLENVLKAQETGENTAS